MIIRCTDHLMHGSSCMGSGACRWKGNDITLWNGHYYRTIPERYPFGGAVQRAAHTNFCGIRGQMAMADSAVEQMVIAQVADTATYIEDGSGPLNYRPHQKEAVWVPMTAVGIFASGGSSMFNSGRTYSDPPLRWVRAAGALSGTPLWVGSRPECEPLCDTSVQTGSGNQSATDANATTETGIGNVRDGTSGGSNADGVPRRTTAYHGENDCLLTTCADRAAPDCGLCNTQCYTTGLCACRDRCGSMRSGWFAPGVDADDGNQSPTPAPRPYVPWVPWRWDAKRHGEEELAVLQSRFFDRGCVRFDLGNPTMWQPQACAAIFSNELTYSSLAGNMLVTVVEYDVETMTAARAELPSLFFESSLTADVVDVAKKQANMQAWNRWNAAADAFERGTPTACGQNGTAALCECGALYLGKIKSVVCTALYLVDFPSLPERVSLPAPPRSSRVAGKGEGEAGGDVADADQSQSQSQHQDRDMSLIVYLQLGK
jgi:hypothetical protein